MKTNHLILGLAALMASTPVLAKDVKFTDGVLARVQAVQNGQERLRVYLNRTLVVERNTDAGTDTTDVHGGVDVVLEQHKLKEIIKRGTLGKIVAVEATNITGTEGESCAGKHEQLVYVTFDPSCNTKECAWAFGRKYSLQTSGYYSYTCSGTTSSDETYYLAAVPGNSLYSHVELYSKKGLMKRHMSFYDAVSYNNAGVYLTAKDKYSIALEVDLDQLLKVVSQTVVHPGVGNPDGH
ncbi:MAG TPA: hypothetical protein VL588_08545 [Bdellovibrionota bacterium]|nr:hypothetical protein [Bdellovibrionota bacterium]